MKRFYLLSLLFVSHIVWCLSYHHLQLGQYPFDHLQLVQTWPNTFCTTSPGKRPVNCTTRPQEFILHGLWPANENAESLINETNCTTNLSGVFKELRDDLHEYWPSITTWENESLWTAEWAKHGRCSLSNSRCDPKNRTSVHDNLGAADINIASNSNSYSYVYNNRCDISDKNFWQHEWNKHEICPLSNSNSQTPVDYSKNTIVQDHKTNFLGYHGAADDIIIPSNPPTTDIPIFTTPLDYFKFTIDQIKKVHLLRYLEDKGIKPHNERLYSKSQIVEALKPLIDKNKVSVSCRTRGNDELLLFEIYICLRINYISCPRTDLPRGCPKHRKFKFPPF